MKLMVLLLGGLFSEESGKDWTIWKKGINNGGSSMKHGKRNTDDDSIDEDGCIIDDNIDLTQTVRFSGNQKGKMNARSNGPFRLTFHYFFGYYYTEKT